MNLLFDISTLGLGARFPAARSGIHRVVEELFRRLVLFDGLQIRPCAGMGNLSDCRRYLAARPHLTVSMASPPPSPLSRLVDRVETFKGWLYGRGVELPSLQLPRLLYRSVRDRTPLIDPKELEGCDVYHSPAGLVPEPVASRPDVRRFFTIHDIIPLVMPDCYAEGTVAYHRRLLEQVRDGGWAVTVSEHARQDLLSLFPGIDPARVSVAPLAAAEIFRPVADGELRRQVRRQYGIDPEAPFILSVSSPNPRKNVGRLVRSFVAAKRQGELLGVSLVLVGGKGWRWNDLHDELGKSGDVSREIVLTGHVPDDHLAALYTDATLFVYPSLYEGFGLPILEAMQCGCPVVTSTVTSMPEVAGDAAILVDPRRDDEIAHALVTLINDPTRREELRKRGLERAAVFSWERSVEMMVKAWKRSL